MSEDTDLRGVAIVGMACRFPGANNPNEFWQNLCAGVDSIRHFDDAELVENGISQRELNRPDYVKASPVIDAFDMFDAGFFEYSPREARLMDPQQRLLLEESWHALEDAGYGAGDIDGRVGAFVGSGGVVTSYLLAQAALHSGTTGGVEHLANDKDFLSTKLSYKLGLTGPSINVQTACSTSMVAVHLACQSILDGECEMALAGGSVVRVPQVSGYTYRAGDILSPDGKCRAYDADAQGTVFGSGTGVVVLKHVEDAIADGDRIYAVIRGSAINNDGADKLSYTASSTEGQQQAMAAAFAVSEIPPSTIGYVEGHGTGTVVGDPLEVEALRRCFASDPQTEKGGCYLGSVKTNIGHLEQAAGIAALIKTTLALHHKQIPPSLNFTKPNPRINFADGPFVVPTASVDWKQQDSPRRAVVNSLGLGGTNAFAVLQEAPLAPAADVRQAPMDLLTISAQSQGALSELARRWHDHLGTVTAEDLSSVCVSAARSRRPMRYRLSVCGNGPSTMAKALADSEVSASPIAAKHKLAFLFPGQGAQYHAMARQFYEEQPAFREAFDAVAGRLQDKVGIDITAIVYSKKDSGALTPTENLQPALFAVEWALVSMLRQWGIVPDAVLGHSVGAYAAAATAGIYTVEDAADLIALRARLMGSLPAGGTMCALFADEQAAADLCQSIEGVCIAAINSPLSTVIAGEKAAVDAVVKRAEEADIASRILTVSHAFHSHLMMPARTEFARQAQKIEAHDPQIVFVSDMTGQHLQQAPDSEYLAEHIMNPVRFADGLEQLAALGCTDYIEIGPGSALRSFLAASNAASDSEAHGLLTQDGSDWQVSAKTLGRLWEKGYPVDLSSYYAGHPIQHSSIPLYPFDRVRYWLDDDGQGVARGEHGLCGEEVRLPGSSRCFQSMASLTQTPWLPDHRVYGEMTLPVAAALIGLYEAGEIASGSPVEVRNLTYREACLVSESESRLLHIELEGDSDGKVSLQSTDTGSKSSDDWRLHCDASLHPYAPEPRPVVDLAQLQRHHDMHVAPQTYYSALDQLGLNYGAGFRNVRELRIGEGSALGRIRLSDDAMRVDAAMHPAVLDACLHLFPAATGEYGDFSALADDDRSTFLPITVERFALHGDLPAEMWSLCRLRPSDAGDQVDGRYTVDIDIFAGDGIPVASLWGLTIKKLTRAEFIPSGQAQIKDWLYGVDWVAADALDEAANGVENNWLLIGERQTDVSLLTSALDEAGDVWTMVEADVLIAAPDAMDTDTDRDLSAITGIVIATGLSTAALDHFDGAGLTVETKRQFDLTQAVLKLATETLSNNPVQPRIWILTRGAQAPLDDHLGGEALQSVLWGHGRAIAQEHPNVWGGLIDIDERTLGASVVAELRDGDDEDQVALRQDKRYAPRLVHRVLDNYSKPVDPPVDPDRSYLITGGLGAIGLHIADWLVAQQGARHVWLVSRRSPDDQQREAIAALQEHGATVHVVSVDIADSNGVEELIDRISTQGPALDGVFHCAGLLADGIMIEMDWEKYHSVTKAKIEGTWVLHRAVEHLDLSQFVLFSSILSVIGSMGQMNYVAGNAFLDGLISYRRRLGLPATAMNWGPWENAGLAVESGERGRAIWRARGTQFIPVETGLHAMTATLANDLEHMVVTHTDWSQFATQFAKLPRLYAQLSTDGGGGSSGSGSGKGNSGGRQALTGLADTLDQLREAQPDLKQGILTAAVEQICSINLELDGAPDSNVSLRELGLDSLMSITVINDIENIFGKRLPARALLRGPSVTELTAMVREELGELFDHAPAESDPSTGDADSSLDASPSVKKPTSKAASSGSWLVVQRPRPEARFRLFCFPFAGGGSAVFDNWGDAFDPSIEIVSVEAPGRLGRIDEEPVRTVEQFARGLIPELEKKLDRPYAVMGHCLGGLTLYETLRFFQARGNQMPDHIFVSGARPPSVLRASGNFEAELNQRLKSYGQFQAGKLGHEQPDEVFAEIVRAFGISESSKMLEEEELRKLILPTVRAEFEMTSRYVYLPERPFPIPITCFRGLRDEYFRAIDAKIWKKFTSRQFEIFERDTGHFAIVEDFDFIRSVIEDRLLVSDAVSA